MLTLKTNRSVPENKSALEANKRISWRPGIMELLCQNPSLLKRMARFDMNVAGVNVNRTKDHWSALDVKYGL